MSTKTTFTSTKSTINPNLASNGAMAGDHDDDDGELPPRDYTGGSASSSRNFRLTTDARAEANLTFEERCKLIDKKGEKEKEADAREEERRAAADAREGKRDEREDKREERTEAKAMARVEARQAHEQKMISMVGNGAARALDLVMSAHERGQRVKQEGAAARYKFILELAKIDPQLVKDYLANEGVDLANDAANKASASTIRRLGNVLGDY